MVPHLGFLQSSLLLSPRIQRKISVCVNMRIPNTAIKRERHITPTMDDIISELNGSTVFSKLDLNTGCHQLELEPESQYIMTFTSQVDLPRYKRLNFSISSASEVFQEAIRGVIQGIPGTLNISDDTIIHGKGTKRHDEALKAVLNRLREHNLTLNKAKCEFHKDRLEFFGNIFSKDRLSADPQKVASIKNASPPENVSELHSLLGMASYCSRFIPNFVTITDPLRELTKKNAKWPWSKAQEEALAKLKTHLTDDTMLGYFDPTKQNRSHCRRKSSRHRCDRNTGAKHRTSWSSNCLRQLSPHKRQTPILTNQAGGPGHRVELLTLPPIPIQQFFQSFQ